MNREINYVGITDEDERDIDTILLHSGQGGKFQICYFTAVCFVQFSIGIQLMNMYFIGYDSPWRCAPTKENDTDFCSAHKGVEFRGIDKGYKERCAMNLTDWEFVESKKCSIVTEFNIVCGSSWENAFANSGFFIGWMVGGMLVGILADVYGRKPVLLVSIVLLAVASISLGLITSPTQFMIARIVAGLAYSGCIMNFIIAMEFFTGKAKSTVGCICQGTFVFCEWFSVMIAYLQPQNWRNQEFYSAIPVVISVFLVPFFPESARWQLTVGRENLAEKTLRRVSAINKKPLDDSVKIKTKQETTMADAKTYSYLDLFRYVAALKLMCLIGWVWFTNGITFFVISLGLSSIGGNRYTNLVLGSGAEIPASIVSIITCNMAILGRKGTENWALFLAGLTCLAIGLIISFEPEDTAMENLRLGLALLGKFLITVAFSAIYVWTQELFPTCVRSQGTAICILTSRIGSIAAPFITNLLAEYSPPLPYYVIAGVCISASISGLFMDETLGKPSRESFDDLLVRSPLVCDGNYADDKEKLINPSE